MANTMEDAKRFAILLVVVGVTLTVGLKITGSVESNIVKDVDVTNETFNATSDPFNYTVSDASNSDFLSLQTATVYDTTSQNSELSATIVNDTTVEVSGGTDAGDESIDYTYEAKDTTARQGAQDAKSGLTELSGFLPIIGLVVAAAIVIGLVSKGFGSNGRRGRA